MADDNMGGFGAGFANALSGDLAQREAAKLQLMMLSKRMEFEHNQKLAEIAAQGQEQRKGIQAQAQAQSVSRDSLAALAKSLGVDNFDATGLPETMTGPFADTAVKSLAEVAARRAEIKAMIAGKQTSIEPHYEPTTGIKDGERQNTIFGKGKVEYDAAANPSIQQAKDIITERDGMIRLKKLIDGQDLTGPIGGRLAQALAAAGIDPKAAGTQAARQSLLTAMPKVLAGFNRFNEPEIQRLNAIPPGLTNTQDVNRALFDNAFAILNDRVSSLGMGQDDVDAGKPNRFDMRKFISPEGQQLFYGKATAAPAPQSTQPNTPAAPSTAGGNNPFSDWNLADLASEMGRQHSNHSKVRLNNAKMQDQVNGR